MSRRQIRTFGLAAIALAAMTVTGANAASALPPGPPVRAASTMASFDGTTFDAATGEDVVLSGALHVVTRISGTDASGWSLEWNVNVDHATGTGRTTGDSYVLDGADEGTVALPPGPPTRSAFFEPTFTLLPPGPPTHPPSPCRFLVAVSFDEHGTVTGVDAHLADAPPPTTD